MHKPVIGITAGSLFSKGGNFPGTERVFVNYSYIHAVLKAGGVPILLPTAHSDPDRIEQLQRIDGIILSGGDDINPLLFDEEPHIKLGFVLADRDAHEIRLAQLAYQIGKPLSGICRGIQVLNVAFGGTLYQDISTQYPNMCYKHSQNSRRDFASHTVDFVQGSLLRDMLKADSLQVNSFHHQAVKAIAPGFIATACSRDGIIEAIEKPGDLFLVGVQWHPELLIDAQPDMLMLFKRLINQSAC